MTIPNKLGECWSLLLIVFSPSPAALARVVAVNRHLIAIRALMDWRLGKRDGRGRTIQVQRANWKQTDTKCSSRKEQKYHKSTPTVAHYILCTVRLRSSDDDEYFRSPSSLACSAGPTDIFVISPPSPFFCALCLQAPPTMIGRSVDDIRGRGLTTYTVGLLSLSLSLSLSAAQAAGGGRVIRKI